MASVGDPAPQVPPVLSMLPPLDEASAFDADVGDPALGDQVLGDAELGVVVPSTVDDTLAEAARREADLRFEAEALPWIDDVYRFALSLTRDEADADDVVQDTYLRAYRSWHTYQPGSDCRRWLFTICRNAFLRTRERARHQVPLEDGDVESVAASVAAAGAEREQVDAALSRIDLAPALADAIRQLQEPFQSAVVLVDVEDQSYESAAEVLGVPIGTVRSRLFRGRRLLQEMLRTYAIDAGFVHG